MSPAEFVNEIALPTLRDFRDNPRSRRHAYLACIVTFHVKDHLSKAGERSVEARMRAAAGDAFDVVRGVCNGAKHLGTNSSHIIAFMAGADIDRPPGRAGEMKCGLSRIGDATGGRNIATGEPGGTDIYGAVTQTLRAYAKEASVLLGGCDLSGL